MTDRRDVLYPDRRIVAKTTAAAFWPPVKNDKNILYFLDDVSVGYSRVFDSERKNNSPYRRRRHDVHTKPCVFCPVFLVKRRPRRAGQVKGWKKKTNWQSFVATTKWVPNLTEIGAVIAASSSRSDKKGEGVEWKKKSSIRDSRRGATWNDIVRSRRVIDSRLFLFRRPLCPGF